MSEKDQIALLVKKVRTRLRLVNAVRYGGAALLAGSAVSFILSFFHHSWESIFPIPVSFFLGFFTGWFFHVSRFSAARQIDSFFQLKERVVTAVEAEESNIISAEMAKIQREETLKKIKESIPDLKVGAKRAVPVFSLRQGVIFFIAVFAAVGNVCWREDSLSAHKTIKMELKERGSGNESVFADDAIHLTMEVRDKISSLASDFPSEKLVQELLYEIHNLPVPDGKTGAAELDRVLSLWQSVLTSPLEKEHFHLGQQSYADSAETDAEISMYADDFETNSSSSNKTGIEGILFPVLKELAGEILQCRSEIPLASFEDGENGTDNAGFSGTTWGKGSVLDEKRGDVPVLEQKAQGEIEFNLAGSVIRESEESFPDKDGPAKVGEIGESFRTFQENERTGTVPSIQKPAPIRDAVPFEMKEIVKKYFDY